MGTKRIKCLFCDSVDAESHFDRESVFKRQNCSSNLENSNDCETVKKQLKVLFLLRKLMNLTENECTDLLQKYGNPSTWLYCCDSCSLIVEAAREVYNQILQLQLQFKNFQNEFKSLICSANLKNDTHDGHSEQDIKLIISSYINNVYCMDNNSELVKGENMENTVLFEWPLKTEIVMDVSDDNHLDVNVELIPVNEIDAKNNVLQVLSQSEIMENTGGLEWQIKTEQDMDALDENFDGSNELLFISETDAESYVLPDAIIIKRSEMNDLQIDTCALDPLSITEADIEGSSPFQVNHTSVQKPANTTTYFKCELCGTQLYSSTFPQHLSIKTETEKIKMLTKPSSHGAEMKIVCADNCNECPKCSKPFSGADTLNVEKSKPYIININAEEEELRKRRLAEIQRIRLAKMAEEQRVLNRVKGEKYVLMHGDEEDEKKRQRAEYQRIRRANVTEKQRVINKEKVKNYIRLVNEDEKEERNRRRAESQRIRRAKMTEEEKTVNREKNKQAARIRRASVVNVKEVENNAHGTI